VFELLDASLKKEEHDREELNKREQRISTERQRLIAEAARRAREAGRHASAMRLALAGEPSEEERARGIASEPAVKRAPASGAYLMGGRAIDGRAKRMARAALPIAAGPDPAGATHPSANFAGPEKTRC
jgi:hypothetical protein